MDSCWRKRGELCLRTCDAEIRKKPNNLSVLLPLDFDSFPVPIHHTHWLPPIRILHGFYPSLVGRLRQSHADGEIGLQLIHPGLDLVLIDCVPNIRRPVLVKLFWVLDKEHFIRINPIVAPSSVPTGTA